MTDLLKRFTQDTSGATAVEYGLIAGMISILTVSTMSAVGVNVNAALARFAPALG